MSQEETKPRRGVWLTNQNAGKVTRQLAQLVENLGIGGIVTVKCTTDIPIEDVLPLLEALKGVDGCDIYNSHPRSCMIDSYLSKCDCGNQELADKFDKAKANFRAKYPETK